VLSENSEDDSLAGLTSTQLSMRRNLEQYLGKKVEGMLEKVLGPGQAIVRVAADVNYDTVSTMTENFDPDGQVVRSETKNDENNDTSQATGSEAVGVSINTASSTNATSSGPVPVSNTKNQKITSRVEYEISKTTSNIVQTAGGVRRLSAAVTIAMRSEGAGDARKPLPRTPEELDKLKRMVASAIGTDTTRGDQVTLEELPFNQEYATEVARQLQEDEKWQFRWKMVGSLGYPLLAVVVLFILVRLLKRTPVDDIPIGIPLGQLAHGRSGNGYMNGKDHGRDVVTVEVLNQLVKENPGNMTQALRNWLGRPGPGEARTNEPNGN
jgi:flagellar M-ring protein FliF